MLADPSNSNVLYCFPLGGDAWGWSALVVQIMMASVAGLSFPVVFYALRDAVIAVFISLFHSGTERERLDTVIRPRYFWGITFVLAPAIAIVSSLPMVNLRVVISWTSGTNMR